MNIQVSHESPLALSDVALLYNDYDYALVHLFEHDDDSVAKSYFNYFRNSVVDGRVVYLDNSIFELGESFDPDKYISWIKRLIPTYYIVPDVLEDSIRTRQSFDSWFRRVVPAKDEDGIVNSVPCIGVVQGKDWNDLVSCYRFMAANADMIAISFDYKYYLSTGRSNPMDYVDGNHDIMYEKLRHDEELDLPDNPMSCSFCRDKQHRYMSGRQRFIQQLIDEGIWEWNKPHHLLGCSLPQEFSYYTNKNIYNIRSIDTSNPVMSGLQGYRYRGLDGMPGKPAGLLANQVDMVKDGTFDTKKKHVLFNTDSFKHIINREPVFDHTNDAHKQANYTISRGNECGSCGEDQQ